MRILLLCYNYPPLKNGGVVRPLKMKKYLPLGGHEVFVLTHTYEKHNINNLEPDVFRAYDLNRKYKAEFFITRAIFELSTRLGSYQSRHKVWLENAKKKAVDSIAKVKPDCLLATYPPHETFELALYLAEKYSLPLITDFRDGLIFESVEGKAMQRPAVQAYLRKLEQEVVKASQVIVTVSEPISDYLRQMYGHEKVFTIPNGFDEDDFRPLDLNIQLNPLHFNVVYTGRLAKSDEGCDASIFFKAVERLCETRPELIEKLRLYFIGDFTSDELSQMTRLQRLGILQLKSSASRYKALAYQGQADLLLLITSLNRKSVATTKLFEYLYSGKPIFALTHETYAATIIEEAEAGWLVHPQDEHVIYETLLHILTKPGFYRSVTPQKARVKKFSRKTQMTELATLIHQSLPVKGKEMSHYKEKVG